MPLTKPTSFPDSFAWDISAFLVANIDPGVVEAHRPPRPTDKDRTIAVIPRVVVDGETFMGSGAAGHGIEQYQLEVYAMNKAMDPATCLQNRSVLARNIRRLIDGDNSLRQLLGSTPDMYVMPDGRTMRERFHRLKLERQEYLNNEASGTSQQIAMSLTILTVETETSQA